MEIAAEQDVESVEEIEQRFVFFRASLISPTCHTLAEISSSQARKSHATQRCERGRSHGVLAVDTHSKTLFQLLDKLRPEISHARYTHGGGMGGIHCSKHTFRLIDVNPVTSI